jgi:hypothetical protein
MRFAFPPYELNEVKDLKSPKILVDCFIISLT